MVVFLRKYFFMIQGVKPQKTKIVATVGPACNSYEQLLALAQAGVDVFRLNFSHGTHEQHLDVMQHIQRIRAEYSLHCSILADLQGPKLRVGEVENNGIEIQKGDVLTFVQDKCVGTKERIYMSYEYFAQDVKVGERVMVDDGNVVLKVLETNGVDRVRLEVLFGSVLRSKKGVNLPDTVVSQPSLTDKDIEDLNFVLGHDVNWIALSFVRKATDIDDLRRRINERGHPALIIAKIEKPEAVLDIENIVRATDAVMVARGDLGVEMPIEHLPMTQKRIVTLCNLNAKPVIVATQMMESMIHNPSPTRAETTDVANAVIDGADAVMLSGETAAGDHPVLVVETMNRIVAEVEKSDLIYNKSPKSAANNRPSLSDSVCRSSVEIAAVLDAKAIVGITVSGYTAFQVSSFRPKADICIFSPYPHILATLSLVWGVRAFLYEADGSTDETVEQTHQILKEFHVVKEGDVVVNTGAMPIKAKLRTNMMRVGHVR